MRRLLLAILTSISIAAPATAQTITTNNVTRLTPDGCVLRMADGTMLKHICEQLAITQSSSSTNFWFEDQAEQYGFGFAMPTTDLPLNTNIPVERFIFQTKGKRLTIDAPGHCIIKSDRSVTCVVTADSDIYAASAVFN